MQKIYIKMSTWELNEKKLNIKRWVYENLTEKQVGLIKDVKDVDQSFYLLLWI